MRSRKVFITVLVTLGLLAILNQHSRVVRRRAEVTQRTAEALALEIESSKLTAEIKALGEELQREKRAADNARISESKVRAEVAAATPGAQWAEPPETLPDWNPASPVVWVSKDLLTQIPIEPFSKNGELNPGVAEVLGIKPEVRKELDGFMAAELERFRNLELTNVYLSTNHLPGVSHIEGRKLTIELRPPAEAGAELKERLTAVLANKLGAQRAGILMEQGQRWFAENVSSFAQEPKIISVGWRPTNGYSLSIKGAGVWKSFGGLSELKGHIPGHLLPYFFELSETTPENE